MSASPFHQLGCNPHLPSLGHFRLSSEPPGRSKTSYSLENPTPHEVGVGEKVGVGLHSPFVESAPPLPQQAEGVRLFAVSAGMAGRVCSKMARGQTLVGR